MDELALLRDFRLEDAAADGARDHARAALRAAAYRERHSRRRTFIFAAFVAAAILAGAAYGVARELTVGDPAPEEVREQPARFGHSAELIPVPHPEDPRLDEARVAAVLDSSAGTVYLFTSPNARGVCQSIWLEGDRGQEGRLNMPTACGPRNGQSSYAFSNREAGSFRGRDFRADPLRLFWGRAGDGVARIGLRFGDRTVDVPMTGRSFLAEFPEQPDAFVSFDAAGRVLEQRTFPRLRAHRPMVKPQPQYQVTRAHEVARIRTRGGSETVRLFIARANDGGYCQIVRSDQTPSNRTCAVAPPAPHEIGVAGMNFGGGAPDGILLLVGPAGSKVARLELRYQDGRVANVPLNDGWALYEVERADYVQGRRPELIVARDASGHKLGSKGFPWVTTR
jgi:hypothetical protein